MKEYLAKALDVVRQNWKIVGLVLLILGQACGVVFTLKKGDPGTKPEIIIVIPDSGGFVTQTAPELKGKDTQAGEYLAAQIVLRITIAILERRAPTTPSEWDDRLLVILKLFTTDRAAFERAEKAALGR